MKEDLQGKLVEILTSIQSAAGKASDFAMEQLPDIAQSYVAHGRATETIGFVFGFVLVVFSIFVFLKGIQLLKNGDESGGFCMIGSAISGMIGFIIAASSYSGMLMVWFAPKVWLLKEMATLIK